MRTQNQSIPLLNFKKSVDSGFEIIKFNKILQKEYKNHSPFKPHKVNFYLFLFITKGIGKHLIDFNYYDYKEGDLLIISKNQLHAFGNKETDGFAIMFTEKFLFENVLHIDVSFLNRLYNYQMYSPLLNNAVQNVGNVIILLINEFESENLYGKKESLRLLLQYLFIKIIQLSNNNVSLPKNTEWIKIFLNYILKTEENYKKTRNVNDYAEMLNISYKHLNEICKEVSNKTAKEVLDDFVILELKRFISLNNATGDELSVEFGFDETTNLVKYFKKHTNLTPKQFKISQQK